MDLKRKYLTLLKANQHISRGFRYTVPSSTVYPYQWLWDSCFHAIIYTHFDIDYAKDEIRSILNGQWKKGMIPHMIYWRKTKKYKLDWRVKNNTSSITQPPMIAYAVETIYNKTYDIEFVHDVLDKLHLYYQWIHKERSNSYIPIIIHPWESGQDDSILWDEIYKLDNPSKDTLAKKKLEILNEYIKTGLNAKKFALKNKFNVKCLLFDSVYLRNLKSMLTLSKVAKSKHYKYYKSLIPQVEKYFKKRLYNKEKKIFSSVYNNNTFISPPENSSMFLPLFAQAVTKKQTNRLIKDLLNEDKFWLRYPVPTIPAENINFQPNRYWRGSTWININWFIIKGLKNYGYDMIANNLKKKTIDMVKKSGFCEYYNPITGKGLGPNDFTWSGLIFDM
jgi:glycogen debranching enzyme